VATDTSAGGGLARDIGACCARIGAKMPAWSPRRGARCGAGAAEVRAVRVAGASVDLPLCRMHLKKLLESDDQGTLARCWSPEPPADAP
jgi:hypothetical protein